MATNTKQRLEAEISKLRAQLAEITNAEDDAANARLVGRCFRVRDCYSMPSKPSDYWYVYVKVVSAVDGLQCLCFHVDCNGCIWINADRDYMRQTLEGYEPVTCRSFDSAYRKCLALAREYL